MYYSLFTHSPPERYLGFECFEVLKIMNKAAINIYVWAFVKNPLAMQETRAQSLGWEDPWKEGNSNLFQYSCMETPMDRGAWWAIVHGVAQNQTPFSH